MLKTKDIRVRDPYIVNEGGVYYMYATTCFEAWGKDQKWNTSLCHPWASAPISVLAEDILPAHPEYGKIVYKKNSDGGMK